MKKINIILIVLTIGLFAGACETYDDYNTDRLTIARFHTVIPRQATPPFENAKITLEAGGTDLRQVELFTSDEAAVDRTFNVIVVDSLTTVASENYSFASTVTIPANQRRGILIFNATDVSLTESYEDVAIAIEPITGSIVAGPAFILELRWK